MTHPLAALTSLGDAKASLAADLATQLLPVPDIMKRHNVTVEQLRTLMADSQFRHMVKEFRREWHSPLSAKERVRLKSSLAVEDGLLELYALFKDVSASPQARLEAFKQLTGLADMGPKRDAQAQGATFSLTLNLGGEESQTLVIDGAATQDDAMGEEAHQ